MRVALVLATLFAAPAPALAECPPVPDHAEAYAQLYDALSDAETPAEAQALSDALWDLRLIAPDEPAQALLDQGLARRNAGDLPGSIRALDRLVAYCPEYAEGWNQRAFSHFLGHDHAAALPDLDRALALDPRHLGALTGRALTLLGLGRDDEAYAVLRQALALNPWLSERRLLPGRDI
ncbi:MAG: TPR repeat [Rhodobacteraceae bacterium HLUCCA08]|nr:MAG: TPR repeat [Rhodobacteraceae bacterium HLUCCA08]